MHKLWTKHAISNVSVNLRAKQKISVLNLEHIVKNSSFLTILLRDFNTISQAWYKKDISTAEGFKDRYNHSSFWLNSDNKRMQYILNKFASCIDLTLNSQPNLVMHFGVDPCCKSVLTDK